MLNNVALINTQVHFSTGLYKIAPPPLGGKLNQAVEEEYKVGKKGRGREEERREGKGRREREGKRNGIRENIQVEKWEGGGRKSS